MAARNYVAVVEKTMAIFEALSRFEGSAELKAIADKAGVGKSTVFRILYTLKELGYVDQQSYGQTYNTTAKVFGLARSPAKRPRLRTVVHPYLLKLRNVLQESTWFAEWRGGVAVLVDVVESPQYMRMSYDVGDRCPLHASALGKAIAAYLPDDELQQALPDSEYPRFTPYTVCTHREVTSELATTRKRGYAVNNQETVEGAIVFAAPLMVGPNDVAGAISVTSSLTRCSAVRRQQIIREVKTAAAAASETLVQLGYRAPRMTASLSNPSGISREVTP